MVEFLKNIDAINSRLKELKLKNTQHIHITEVEQFLINIKEHFLSAEYENRLDKYAKYGKDKSTSAIHYTNIIITAGYAGYFGLWSISKDFVSPIEAKITFILIAISMFSFVMYEVIDNALSGSNIENGCKALLKAKEEDNLKEKVEWANIASTYDEYRPLWYYQFWSYSFAVSVVFGLLAYFLLIKSIIVNI